MKLSDQVATSLAAMHPGVRKDIRRALDEVNAGKKRDVAVLAGRLKGYRRLRVGRHRVVFRYSDSGELIAEYLGPRGSVYRNFDPRD